MDDATDDWMAMRIDMVVRPIEGRHQIHSGQHRVNSKAAMGFFHLAIVNSVPLLFLHRNTMFWPNLLHFAATPVENT